MFLLLLKAILQLWLVILMAPLLNGIIKKIKAASQHRKGAPILQLYFDIFKLLKKDTVISENASWVFRFTPYIYISSILLAFLFIPVVPQLFSFRFLGDAVMLVYLLAMARFFMVLAGLDTGSTFGGMGSSREMMVSALMEPSLLVVLFTLGLNAKPASTSLAAIYGSTAALGTGMVHPVYILLFGAMFIILIAETARIPVDDPSTHLELTMIHEAMLLEYSGKYLAMMELGSALKQLLYITMIVNFFIPFGNSFEWGMGFLTGLFLYVLKVLFITVLLVGIEMTTVKLRLFSLPNLAALSFILAVLGFMSGFIFGR